LPFLTPAFVECHLTGEFPEKCIRQYLASVQFKTLPSKPWHLAWTGSA
jgi:hypothetical protein